MIVNVLGAVMLIAGLIPAFLVGGLVDEIWPKANKGVPVGYMVFTLIAVGSDLVYRWRNFRERGRIRFVHPFTGGMFFFIPIWMLFVAPFLALPVVLILYPPKNIPPPRTASAAIVHPVTQELSWNIDLS